MMKVCQFGEEETACSLATTYKLLYLNANKMSVNKIPKHNITLLITISIFLVYVSFYNYQTICVENEHKPGWEAKKNVANLRKKKKKQKTSYPSNLLYLIRGNDMVKINNGLFK